VSFPNSGGMLDTDLGATRMLAELHYQFDILDRDSELSGYRLIVLPDSHTVEEPFHRKL
jgi:beta-galactosidase GanA